MAFSTLDYLKYGNVDFMDRQTEYDREHLIEEVRKREDKNDIINGFLSKLIEKDPSFCFLIIYDNDAYEVETKALLAAGQKLTNKKILNLLTKTKWGKDYIYDNIEEMELIIHENYYPKLFSIFMQSPLEYSEYISHYKSHPNTHIRFLFMKYLLEKHEDLFDGIYPDVMLYLTSVTYRKYEQLTLFPDYMDNKDICDLALLIFRSKYRYRYFAPLKAFILEHYPENDLAKLLINPVKVDGPGASYHMEENKEGIKEFSYDANRLFLSSATEKFNIIQNYPKLISKKILEEFLAYYNRFREYDEDVLALINFHRLGTVLLEFIDKYLALSNNPTWHHIEEGSTGTVYQMGDYVLKLFMTKWFL